MQEKKSLRNASIRQRLAREQVAAYGWSGTKGTFVSDREKARREERADVRSSGRDYDPELEAAAGAVHGRPVRALVWSPSLKRHVWWHHEADRRRWTPEGVELAVARKLRVELSDANEGKSVEEVLADRLEVA